MTLVRSTGAVVPMMSLSVVTTLFAATLVGAQSQLGSSSSKTVVGKVSAVEGEFHMAKNSLGEDILKMVDKSYVITTPTGQEIELKLSRAQKSPQEPTLETESRPRFPTEAKSCRSCWSSKAVWLLQHVTSVIVP